MTEREVEVIYLIICCLRDGWNRDCTLVLIRPGIGPQWGWAFAMGILIEVIVGPAAEYCALASQATRQLILRPTKMFGGLLFTV
jgi:hypothetical protein